MIYFLARNNFYCDDLNKNLTFQESELIKKIALNQIEFERTRLGKKEVKENELINNNPRLIARDFFCRYIAL